MANAPDTLSQRLIKILDKTYMFIGAGVVGLAFWIQHAYGGAAVVRALGALFGLIGLAVLAYAARAASRARSSSEWRPAEARILNSSVDVRRDSGARSVYTESPTRTPVTFYTPSILYEYNVAGLTYQSTSVLVANVNWSKADAEAIVARYPAGGRAIAWVDPRNPHSAILERDAEANRSAYTTAAIVGAIFTVLGWAVWVLMR